MIVDPDFFGHWKTKMLVGLTSDINSPLCVIKLWAYCQNRRQWIFPGLTPLILKAIVEFPGDADVFFQSMLQSGWLDLDGEGVIVHEWESYNATLVRNWKNGGKGGRKTAREENPNVDPTKIEKPRTEIDISGLTQNDTNPQTGLTQIQESVNPELEKRNLGYDEMRWDEMGSDKSSSSKGEKTTTTRFSDSELPDESFLVELRQQFGEEHVEKRVKKARAWLMTPKGKGRKLSKHLVFTFVTSEDFSEKSAPAPMEYEKKRNRVTGKMEMVPKK